MLNLMRNRSLRIRLYRWNSGKRAFWAKLLIILILILVFCIVIIIKLSPIVARLALSNATDIMRDMIGKSVGEVLSGGDYDYSQLVTLEKGSSGNITALVTDMKKINSLQTQTAQTVLKNVNENDEIVIRIPLGSLAGISILSGAGPKVKVKLLSVTSVDTSFSEVFASAGINQTRHQILLTVTVDVGVVLPTETPMETVSMQIVVAETVVVGTVPGTYTDIK